MKAIWAGIAMVLVVMLGAGGVAGASSAGDKKAYKAFLAHLQGVELAAFGFTKAVTGPDPSDAAIQAPCRKLAKAVAAAHAKRPKRVKAAVWQNVTIAYAHYKAAAAACALAAPATTHFSDAVHEFGAGNRALRKVDAALHR